MTTADGAMAPTEQLSPDFDEAAPADAVHDPDMRAIPVMESPSAGEPPAGETSPSLPSPSPEESSRPDMFDTLVLPVVPPRPLPVPMVRRELQRPAGAGTARHKGRASAPVALRVTVGVLFLLLLATSGLLVALQARPGAFDSLRETDVIPAGSQPTTTPTTVPPIATHASLVSTTSTAVTYSVPTSSYSIVISIKHPCWLVVHSPASSSSTLVAKTIEPSLSPLTVPVHGSASITIAARAASLSIVSGSTVLDTVDNPRLGVAYTFVPTNS
jgi:hypothetical protein